VSAHRHGAWRLSIHRRSFALVREVLGLPPLPPARSGVDSTIVAAIEASTDVAGSAPSTRRHTRHSPSPGADVAEHPPKCEIFLCVDDDVDRVTQ
jgi:hypothetical protein